MVDKIKQDRSKRFRKGSIVYQTGVNNREHRCGYLIQAKWLVVSRSVVNHTLKSIAKLN